MSEGRMKRKAADPVPKPATKKTKSSAGTALRHEVDMDSNGLQTAGREESANAETAVEEKDSTHAAAEDLAVSEQGPPPSATPAKPAAADPIEVKTTVKTDPSWDQQLNGGSHLPHLKNGAGTSQTKAGETAMTAALDHKEEAARPDTPAPGDADDPADAAQEGATFDEPPEDAAFGGSDSPGVDEAEQAKSKPRPELQGVHLNLSKRSTDDPTAWYCLVPLEKADDGSGKWVINWTSILRVYGQQMADRLIKESLQNGTSLAEVFKGCVVTTTHNHLTYDVLAVEEGVGLDDKMPEMRRKLKTSSKKIKPEEISADTTPQETLTFREYFKKRWSVALEDTKYLLVCTSKSLLRRMEVGSGQDGELGEVTVLLPPQLCTIHGLQREAILLSKHLPPVMWWIHTLLLSFELRSQLTPQGVALPDVKLIAEAITPTHCQQNFSYERLETLGDAFLKYDCCTHVFFTYPKAHEGQLAECKQSVISNSNLGVLGYIMGLAAYTSLPASKIDWATGQNTERQKSGHKVVADCMEALIGAFYTASGEAGASQYMRHIGLLPPMPQTARQLPTPDRSAESPSASKLEAMVGHKFRDMKLLKEACTHCSWPDQSAPCYQRLEFLGDAVLDFLISRYYILGYRDIEPGKLHDLRSASVNNARLAVITAWYRLHPFLRYFSTRLFGEIATFVGSVKDAQKGKLPLQARSEGHARRMEQFSSRNYKGKNHKANSALVISTWAKEDPSDVSYPASISQQNKAKDSVDEKRTKEKHRHRSRSKERSSRHGKKRRDTDGHQDERSPDGRHLSHERYRPSSRRRVETSTDRTSRHLHDERRPPPASVPPPTQTFGRNQEEKHRQGDRRRYDKYSGGAHSQNGYADGGPNERHRSHHSSCHADHQNGFRPSHQGRTHRKEQHHRRKIDKEHDTLTGPSPHLKSKLAKEKDNLDLFISAGFGQGFAAAPKVLGDLFEAIVGAVYVDSGGDLELMWGVVQPFLQPMVHPDNVPCHPARAILELAQKAGLQASFRQEKCEVEGCYSMSTIINGRIVGLCKSAITRDYARLLSAEEAVEKWTEPLISELQQLPQTNTKTKGTAAASQKSAPEGKVWGLEVAQKLGPKTVPPKLLSPKAIKTEKIADLVGSTSQLVGSHLRVEAKPMDLPESLPPQAISGIASGGESSPNGKQTASESFAQRENATTNGAGEGHQVEGNAEALADTAMARPNEIDAFLQEMASSAEGKTDAKLQLAAPKSAMRIPQQWLSKMQRK